MSSEYEDKEPAKKHRHDLDQDVGHGPEATADVTKVIQVILGLCIVLSAGLPVYALTQAALGVSAPAR